MTWGDRKTRNLYLKREPVEQIRCKRTTGGSSTNKNSNVLNFEGEAIGQKQYSRSILALLTPFRRLAQAHPPTCTLLFLSLPALGDIGGSTQAAEPAVVALVADDTAAKQATKWMQQREYKRIYDKTYAGP